VGCRNTVEFPEVSEYFPEVSGGFRRFPEVFPMVIKRGIAMDGDRTHVLRITDLVLYLPATAAI
jgi:hypothetical protein